MKQFLSKYLTLLFCLSIVSVHAQEGKISRAEKKYDELAYIDASEIYLKVAQSGYKSKELFEKLGNTYYFNANYREAVKWYSELFIYTQNVKPIYLLRYSQSLKATGDSNESKKYYSKFLESIDSKNDTLKSVDDYIELIEKNSGRYTVNPVNINTSGVDFGGSIYDEKHLVFASTRDTGVAMRRKHKWNELPFMDLYKSEIGEDGNLSTPEKLEGEVNSKFHETTPSFTKDGKTMYFTSNNIKSVNKKEITKLKIYRAQLIDDEWTNIEELSTINSDEFSTSHPCLSLDETKLYFASDRPGGEGLLDIYVSEIDAQGNVGEPKNLGSKVNTKGRESFPYITKKNELYYSSDGHFGLGGYDIFYMDLNDVEPELINVGTPLNSSFDDVAFSINVDTKKGYISSNRDSEMGYDDIYSFIENEPIKKTECELHGVVTDKETNEPLSDVTLTIVSSENEIVDTLKTNGKGAYNIVLKCGDLFIVKGEKEEYESEETAVTVEGLKTENNFSLEKEKQVVIEENVDISRVLNIQDIYFDFDESYIKLESEVELQKVVAFMKLYPKVKLDVRSHTDSRGKYSYNMALSQRRNKSTIQYIIDKGISQDRLSGRGYGETQLINHCSNGVKCSDQEHQLNRRSEFIIVKN